MEPAEHTSCNEAAREIAEQVVQMWMNSATTGPMPLLTLLIDAIADALLTREQAARREERERWALHVINGTGFPEALEVARGMKLEPRRAPAGDAGQEGKG